MDFPAIDKTMKLKAFNLNEFCLCQADDDASPPLPPPPNPERISARPVSIRFTPHSGTSPGLNSLTRRSPPPLMILEAIGSEKSPYGVIGGVLSRNDSFTTVRYSLLLLLFLSLSILPYFYASPHHYLADQDLYSPTCSIDHSDLITLLLWLNSSTAI